MHFFSSSKLRNTNYPNIKIKNSHFLIVAAMSSNSVLKASICIVSIILTTTTNFTSRNLPHMRIKGWGCLLLEYIKWLLLLLLLRLYQNQVKYIAQQWVKTIKHLQVTLLEGHYAYFLNKIFALNSHLGVTVSNIFQNLK